MKVRLFTVEATVDFGPYIGRANVLINARDSTDWYVESVQSQKHGYKLPPEQLSAGVMREIADEVQDYFIGEAEYRCAE